MKTLLTYPPTSLEKGWNPLRFPLGILSLASYLKDKGFETEIYYDHPYTRQALAAILKKTRPDVVGFSCDSTNFNACFELGRLAKKIRPDTLVLLGGIHATFFDKQILERVPAIDIIVRYEGEETLVQILKHLQSKKTTKGLKDIKGITYRAGNRIAINPERPFIKDLDTLPLLSYESVDMSKIELSHNFPGWWPIHTGRGCPYACKFCASVGQWKRAYRSKSPERIIEEIEICRDRYHIRGCFFYDLTFTINKKRVLTICDHLKKLKPTIRWGCRTRIDCVDDALLKNMRAAGCERIVYGVESFSDRILKLMGKPYKGSEAVRFLNRTKQAGIQSIFQIMLGFPGETETTLKENLESIKKLEKGVVCNSVNIYQLHPGSTMYTMAEKLGLIDDEAWFAGFRMEDFVHRYYPASFLEKIRRTRRDIESMFKDEDMPKLPL